MKLTYLIGGALLSLAGFLPAQAQIMPWENRTETDSDPFAKSTEAKKGGLYLEDVVNGSLIQTRGAGAVNWLKDGERYSRIEPDAEGKGRDIVAYRAKDNKREVNCALPHVYRQKDREAYPDQKHFLEQRQQQTPCLQ